MDLTAYASPFMPFTSAISVIERPVSVRVIKTIISTALAIRRRGGFETDSMARSSRRANASCAEFA